MSDDLKAKLAQLKELHELGLLTAAAYEQQQTALLAAVLGTTPAPSSSPALSGATTVGAPPSAAAPAPVPTAPLAGATTADPTAGLPSRLGNYRVLGVIGAGGMGTVVRARHDSEGWAKQQGGDVALKLIHPHIAADPSFQERFFAEAALGKRVQHPGLATVYDVVQEGPWLGLVLERVEGKDLSAWVRPGGLPLAEVLALLTPLAEALDHLHGQGIVHRDLKPANVKVRPDGRPVLLDLGIAKDLSGQSGGQTQTMTAMGTSAWMAPEQADAKSVTAAADVYAFGLIAYALLSGRMPWGDGESALRVLLHKQSGHLEPLESASRRVSPVVAQAVAAALAADPERRPRSCGALLAAAQGGPAPKPAPGSPKTTPGPRGGEKAPAAPAAPAALSAAVAASLPAAAAAHDSDLIPGVWSGAGRAALNRLVLRREQEGRLRSAKLITLRKRRPFHGHFSVNGQRLSVTIDQQLGDFQSAFAIFFSVGLVSLFYKPIEFRIAVAGRVVSVRRSWDFSGSQEVLVGDHVLSFKFGGQWAGLTWPLGSPYADVEVDGEPVGRLFLLCAD